MTITIDLAKRTSNVEEAPIIDLDQSIVDLDRSIIDLEEPVSSEKAIFTVARGQKVVDDDSSDTDICGFSKDYIRARSALSYEQERRALWKVDLHLMTLCSVIFLFKNLDYSNVAYTKVMNLGTPTNILTQLNITVNEYNFVASIYFIPYILFEIPSTLLIKRFTPSKWQSRIMVSWGLVLACHCAVKSKSGLYAARFFLGLCEAGMFPGVISQLIYWYRPDELSVRLTYFYILGAFSSVVTGALSYGCSLIDGRGNLSGWQWLFLIEGITTVLLGISLWFTFPDYPDTAKFLSQEERDLIQARLPANSPRAQESNWNFAEIKATLRDPLTWMFTTIWAFHTIGTYGLTYILPTVIAELGFTSSTQSLLLNIPPAALSMLWTLILGLLADRAVLPRPVFSLFSEFLGIACYIVFITTQSPTGIYIVCIIASMTGQAFLPVTWPWRSKKIDYDFEI